MYLICEYFLSQTVENPDTAIFFCSLRKQSASLNRRRCTLEAVLSPSTRSSFRPYRAFKTFRVAYGVILVLVMEYTNGRALLAREIEILMSRIKKNCYTIFRVITSRKILQFMSFSRRVRKAYPLKENIYDPKYVPSNLREKALLFHLLY